MRCLLDSHALIWWWNADPRLSSRMRELLIDRSNAVFVSAASGWELATKFRSGRLPSIASRTDTFYASVREDGFQNLDVRMEHGLLGGLLESDHRDPFDRLLAAQAQVEDLAVVTRDRAFKDMGCKVLW